MIPIIAESSAKWIEQANSIAYIVIGVVLVTAIICGTIIILKGKGAEVRRLVNRPTHEWETTTTYYYPSKDKVEDATEEG